nr:hypothetical protein [uncultured Desulfobacter sp.]
MSDYPRVLVLTGYGFNQTCGGSITLTNLFRDWPKDKLAIMFSDHNENDPKIVEKTLRLQRKLFIPYINIGIPWNTQKAIKTNKTKINYNKKSLRQKSVFLFRSLLRKVFNGLGITAVLTKYPLSFDVTQFCNSFKPEVLYTHLGGVAVAALTLELMGKYDIPTVIHIMDDYPSNIYRTGLMSSFVRKKMNSQLDTLFKNAAVCMGICEAMCKEYRERYGVEFIPFHNPVHPCFEKKYDNNSISKTKDSIVAIYSGRVSWGVVESLKDICKAFIELKQNNDKQHIFFKIYTNDVGSVISQHPFFASLPSNVEIEEVPQNTFEVASLFKNSDLLILPVEFQEESIKAIRLSMPTKVPAYMASGTPILLYGPQKVPFVADAAKRGWAHVVGSQANLLQSLKDLIENQGLKNNIVKTAIDISSKEFNYEIVQERFIKELKRASSSSFE